MPAKQQYLDVDDNKISNVTKEKKMKEKKIKYNQFRKHVCSNARFNGGYVKSHHCKCAPQQSIFKLPLKNTLVTVNTFNVQLSFRSLFSLS